MASELDSDDYVQKSEELADHVIRTGRMLGYDPGHLMLCGQMVTAQVILMSDFPNNDQLETFDRCARLTRSALRKELEKKNVR